MNTQEVINVAEGIIVVDSGYYSKDFASIYLLRQNNKVAIIETGTNYSVPVVENVLIKNGLSLLDCLLYTSPSPRDRTRSRMPSSA